ncbi:MAG: S49 family peptidase [Gammaproteobacteria bacterium]|nr:S49 family peptidase [Gammaproteobacteria bacterium]
MPSAEQTRRNAESELINDLAFAALKEKQRARRWNIAFRLIGFMLFALLLAGLFGDRLSGLFGGTGRHTAVVEVQGIISDGEYGNARSIVESLERALSDRNTAGVILRVNSPGGSPVQSGIVFDEILRLRGEYPSTPIHAVVSDLCASGAYYIASAADNIYADKASLLGSIGVRMDSFGFEGAMDMLGVERRVLTAGENKALLDPFLPQQPEQVAHLQTLLDDIHMQFIDAVRRGRGDRLRDDPALFSGLIWTGAQSVKMGLVDKLANEHYVAREVIGARRLVNFTRQPDLVERVADRLGASVRNGLYNSWTLLR